MEIRNAISNVFNFLKRIYSQTLSSIAFYPVLITLLFLIGAFTITAIENVSLIHKLKDEIPYLIIRDPDIAKTILSTMIAGILSLTVFSFSMVMVVLNQASSNYSPRLLPGLISDKKHQIILGIYIGTLLYSVIILISLGASEVDTNSVGLSTMIAAILGIVCVSLFVYFIDSISKAIQVHNIINKIYKNSDKLLDKTLKDQEEGAELKEYWREIRSEKTGFYKTFDSRVMRNFFSDKKNEIEILLYEDQYVWEGMPILRVKEKLPDKELKSLLLCFDFSQDVHEDNSYTGGLIKLMEVAVKAMSPGINDPGTAIDAINKIGPLVHKCLTMYPITIEKRHDDNLIINTHQVPPKDLMRLIIQPIRQYARHDSSVMHVLINTLLFIKRDTAILTPGRLALKNELLLVEQDIKDSIFNEGDKIQLLHLFKE
ncbi:DUF2254 domain-containing protein [Aquimarina brevivitae]|uniref:Putative membrane protein n=1 Tax=Aquimarina brevivitae TaxID=323412 RepID=A0A4Q7PHZ4_9FLAO|nr:DUF2254 domain-containing protein [Aquimarina brevivitae]RZT00046.1 putative membrane protein [Aquimarina brevivitae]